MLHGALTSVWNWGVPAPEQHDPQARCAPCSSALLMGEPKLSSWFSGGCCCCERWGRRDAVGAGEVSNVFN